MILEFAPCRSQLMNPRPSRRNRLMSLLFQRHMTSSTWWEKRFTKRSSLGGGQFCLHEVVESFLETTPGGTETHIEMNPDHSSHPARLRPVEHPGIGNHELAECHFISVSGSPVGLGEDRGQTSGPTREKALHRGWTEPIANLLQFSRVAAATESVVQGFIADPGFVQLLLGPLMTVEPQPYGKGRIGIWYSRTPRPIPNPRDKNRSD
jgi:hypothetical protein